MSASEQVPDEPADELKGEAQRQALRVGASDRASDDQDFIEQISEASPE